MGRGRVQLRRIENKISRQVTFSKRRTGLLKKANEISVLCEADVAVIVFSPNGKLFEYSTNTSMESILERYERHSYAGETEPLDQELQKNWALEATKLASKLEAIQKSIRNFHGDELEPLNLRELQQLEQQIDVSLKRIRSRKNQMMQEAIAELQKKDKLLHEQNKILEKQLENTMVVGAEEQNGRRFCSASDARVGAATASAAVAGANVEPRRENDVEMEITPASAAATIPLWMLTHGGG